MLHTKNFYNRKNKSKNFNILLMNICLNKAESNRNKKLMILFKKYLNKNKLLTNKKYKYLIRILK
jgi:hypothetical protein